MNDVPLVAHASRLGPAFDLLATYRPGGFFFERGGLGISGSGIAGSVGADPGPERIISLSRSVAEALAAIRRAPEAPPPVAVVSIPFGDDRPAEATIPARTSVRHDRGETRQRHGQIQRRHAEREAAQRGVNEVLIFATGAPTDDARLDSVLPCHEFASVEIATTRRQSVGAGLSDLKFYGLLSYILVTARAKSRNRPKPTHSGV